MKIVIIVIVLAIMAVAAVMGLRKAFAGVSVYSKIISILFAALVVACIVLLIFEPQTMLGMVVQCRVSGGVGAAIPAQG